MEGPEGRPPNVSPARKGWEIDPKEDPSAVGAALNQSSALPVSLGAKLRDLQFHFTRDKCLGHQPKILPILIPQPYLTSSANPLLRESLHWKNFRRKIPNRQWGI